MIGLESSWYESIAWTLVHTIWQASAIAIVLGLTLRVLPTKSSRLRHAASVCALLAVVAASIATIVTLRTNSEGTSFPPFVGPVSTMVESAPALTRPTFDTPNPITPLERSPDSTSATTIASAAPTTPAWEPWLVHLWLAGVAALLAHFTVGLIRLRRFETRGVRPLSTEHEALIARVAARLGVRRRIAARASEQVPTPAVVGWLRPRILLPVSALVGLTTEQLEAVIAHELAHIRRFDPMINLLQATVETVLFFHPAVWWISQRIRIEREHCCDDTAVALTNPLVYARALLSLETLRASCPRPALAATDGSLSERIRRVLTPDAPAPRTKPGWFTILVVLALLSPLGLNARANDSEAPTPTTPVDETIDDSSLSPQHPQPEPDLQVDRAPHSTVRITEVSPGTTIQHFLTKLCEPFDFDAKTPDDPDSLTDPDGGDGRPQPETSALNQAASPTQDRNVDTVAKFATAVVNAIGPRQRLIGLTSENTKFELGQRWWIERGTLTVAMVEVIDLEPNSATARVRLVSPDHKIEIDDVARTKTPTVHVHPAPAPTGTYRVRVGDTLHRIAARVLGDGQRWRELHALNPQLDPERLTVDQWIRVPLDLDASQPTDPKTVRPTPKSDPRLDDEAPAKGRSKGDTDSSTPLLSAVVAVREEIGLVVISVGTDDGVAVGDEFTVYRGDTIIASVCVTRTTPDLSGAEVIAERGGQQIKVGDSATRGLPFDSAGKPKKTLRKNRVYSHRNVDGTVESVDMKSGLLRLSVGKEDGTRRGDSFTIYRGSQFVGKATITRVGNVWSNAKLLFVHDRATPVEVGDKASNRFHDDVPRNDPGRTRRFRN